MNQCFRQQITATLMIALMPLASALAGPSEIRVQSGVIHAGAGIAPTRGVALGFADGTLLFDADRLQIVSSWFGGFVKSKEQPYFGRSWQHTGADAPDTAWFSGDALSIKFAGDSVWKAFELPSKSDVNSGSRFAGYQIGERSIRLRYHLRVGETRIDVSEDLRVESRGAWQGFARVFEFTGLPDGAEVAMAVPRDEDAVFFTAQGQEAAGAGSGATTPACGFRLNKRHYLAIARDAGASWESTEGGRRLVAAPFRMAVDCWRADSAWGADDIAGLVRDAGAVADDFDTKAVVPDRAPTPVASSPRRAAPPLNPRENIDQFKAVTTRRVRFSIKRTSGSGAGIDELEVFGPDGEDNLALKGTASASSVIPGYPIHQIPHLNDGKFGNPHSWVATGMQAWIQIEWAQAVRINKLVWARDRTGVCKDRLATDYRIEVSDDGTTWKEVVGSANHGPLNDAPPITADASSGYLMEAIPPPFPGWRTSGIAFSGDGWMYAIAMQQGEVWRSPIPPADNPSWVDWQRFAVGLNHPIGIQLVDSRIYIAHKPEVTELIDRDGDGSADHYRTVATGWGLSDSWHEYTFGLAVDTHKNLWFTLNTGNFWTHPGLVHHGRFRGSAMRIDHGTETLVEVAKGCRTPNGISNGPGGGIYYTDNQGDWVPSCKLARLEAGHFYGHPEFKQDALAPGKAPSGSSTIWMPYTRSRSTSGPVYDNTGGAFGPFAGQLFVGDVGYGGNPGILRIALEEVDGEWQGACFRFIAKQPLGCQRMAFGPDTQLYVCSLTSGLTRVRFTGDPPLALQTMAIRAGGAGFVISLTKPLAADTVLETSQFKFRRYRYVYSGKYGSPETDVTQVPATAVTLSADRQQITLTVPVETSPTGMIYELTTAKLVADGGEKLQHNQAWYTVLRIPLI